MPSLPFTLRQIELFASLAATGSFRATAEVLGISQASVSNQVKALEEQLGVRLLARTPGRSPRLTPEGHAFQEDLRAFQAAAERLANHRRSGPASEQAARYRLLVGQGLFDSYVRPKLDQFLADHPLIELEFETRPPSREIGLTVGGRQFDFALINQRADMPPDPALQPLARVRGGIYGHRRFAENGAVPMTAAELSRLPFILPQAGSKQEAEVLANLRQHGVHPAKVVGHSQYYDVMAAMLDRGVAVASLTDAILPVAMRETVVQLMPLEDWFLLFYRKPHLNEPRADAVERFLKVSVVGDPDYPAVMRFADV